MLKQIKYISQFAKPLTWTEVEELGARAAEKNKRLGITGVLMAAGDLFFQVLEGPDEAVDAVFHAIEEDSRHTTLLVLAARSDVKERLFPDWSMKSFLFDVEADARVEPLREILTTIFALQTRSEQLVATLERAAWHQMGAATR